MLWFGPQSRYNEDIWEARLSRPNPGKGSPTTEASEQSALLLGLSIREMLAGSELQQRPPAFPRCHQSQSMAQSPPEVTDPEMLKLEG